MPQFREIRKFIADRLNSKEIESELAKIPVYIGSSGNGYRKILFFPAQIKMNHNLKENFDPVLVHEYTHAIDHQKMAPLTSEQKAYLKKAYPMPWINTVYPYDDNTELEGRHINEARAENNALKYILYKRYNEAKPNMTFEEYIDTLSEEELRKTMKAYPSGYLYPPAYDPTNPDYKKELMYLPKEPVVPHIHTKDKNKRMPYVRHSLKYITQNNPFKASNKTFA